MAYQMAERAAGMGPQHRRQAGRETGIFIRRVLAGAAAMAVILAALAGAVMLRESALHNGQVTVTAFNDGFTTGKQDDCQQGDTRACAWLRPQQATVASAVLGGRLGASGLTWQYVTPREARYFRISPRSVVVTGFNRYGQDANTIITPRGRIVATS